MKKDRPLLTVGETLARARISRATYYRLVRRGELAVIRLRPRVVRVSPDDLEQLIHRSRTVIQGPDAA
jgi:excisionase family DNA binding protein